MDTQTLAIVITLSVQTLALGFFGGKLWQLTHQNATAIKEIRTWKHDEVTTRLFQVDELWEVHKEREA